MLREHQLVTLILSLQDSFSSSKAKLAPPASFSRPLARKPPFTIGMIAQASPVDQLLAQREGDEPLDHGGAHLGRDALAGCWLLLHSSAESENAADCSAAAEILI